MGTAGLMAPLTSSAAEQGGAQSSAVFNVKDFGAKGDGKTPDTEAIQKALDAAGKAKGTAYFPPGRYLCHGLQAYADTTLRGDPSWQYRPDGGTALVLDSEDADCMINITKAFGVHIYGLYLQGNRGAQKPIHGIFLNNAEKFDDRETAIVIDDCKIHGFSGHGVFLLRIWLFIIRHSLFHSNKGCGVAIHGWDGFVTDNQFSGNGGHGMACVGPDGTDKGGVGATVMFTANRVEWNGGYGLCLQNGDTWNVTGNCFDRNWGAGLLAQNMTAVAVTGNVFRRCGKDSNRLAEGEVSCQMRLESSAGITVTGNAFLAGRDDGGQGKYTPQVGFITHKLTNTVIASNVLHRGYMDKMHVDQGEHGEGFIFKDNVGCPMK